MKKVLLALFVVGSLTAVSAQSKKEKNKGEFVETYLTVSFYNPTRVTSIMRDYYTSVKNLIVNNPNFDDADKN